MPIAQPDSSGERSEGTTSLSTKSTVGRQVGERSSVREASVQEKRPSTVCSILLLNMFPFFTSFSLFWPCWGSESRWILPGVLLLASGSTLSFLSASPPQQHSTTQQHPPSPYHHLSSSSSPSCCGLTQRNLKICCDVWIPAKTESETSRLVRKPKKHMALILLSHSS